MALAAFGSKIAEEALEAGTRMERGGTRIDDLERLARRFDVVAEIQCTTVEDLRRLLAEDRLPIAYIDRAVFDLTPRQRSMHSIRGAKIHTVIPIRVTGTSVWLNDPMRPRIIRKSIRLFQLAHRLLGSLCVVCSKPKDA